jgi:hypothetical protein
MAGASVNEDEIIWRRRLTKRLAALRFVKATTDYVRCQARPPTPDPFDRAVSKRRWEQRVQDFRRALRDGVPQNPIAWPEAANPLGEFREKEAEGLHVTMRFLCGCWVDQSASFYKLSPGPGGALHVETTRPSGQKRFTKNLVRVAVVCGCEMGIWGRCRYVLERCGPNSLLWHGWLDHDTFAWRRVISERC